MTEEELEKAYLVMKTILESAIDGWQHRRGDYGDAFMELGSKGQFSEIWRKVYKLKRSVWEGYELMGETPEQIAMEIIPHCMMMVYCLRDEDESPSPFWGKAANLLNTDEDV